MFEDSKKEAVYWLALLAAVLFALKFISAYRLGQYKEAEQAWQKCYSQTFEDCGKKPDIKDYTVLD